MPTLTPSAPTAATLGRGAAITLAAAALITLSAKVQVPFWPVPMTLQTLAVLLLSTLIGPRLGLAAMGAYLSAGALGLPVFSGAPERGIGLAYMAGPTGGYLLGFLIAAGVTGALAQGRGLAGQALAMLAGLVAIYAAGLGWLATFVPAPKLLAAGLTPFLLGEAMKFALACTLLAGRSRLKRSRAQ